MNLSLNTILEKAAAGGIIRSDQIAPLAGHLQAHGIGIAKDMPAKGGGYFKELLQPKDDGPPMPSEESEAPRFIRGFHDILITVGIVVALVGLGSLATIYALIPAVILLAEILVKRQRLALPAFALTVAFVIAVVWIVMMNFGGYEENGTVTQLMTIYAACAAALVPFYWRYRIPVSLAALILSAIGLGFFVTMQLTGNGSLQATATTRFAAIIGFVFSVAAFAVAMWFDVRDRLRVTRRSDVAFWLHLGAAPTLLNSALALVLWKSEPGSFWLQNLDAGQAVLAVALIILFMTIGIVIDRRAFVTAGILSLGYAISTLVKGVNLETSNLFAISALAVGIIVLTIGTGWLPIRAKIINALPAAIRNLVPPVVA